MTTAERYADELIRLVESSPGFSDALLRFEQIFDAYMIESSGSFIDKRKALLEAFQARAPQGELAALIADKLGATP